MLSLLLCIMLVAGPLRADEQGTVIRRAAVYADPSSAAERVGLLQAGARVSLFNRKGGWREIFSEEQAIIGWVRVYQVRQGNFDTAVSDDGGADSRGFLAGLASFSRKASGFFSQDSTTASSSTSTIGVRGLSEVEIKSARADFGELEKMKKFASSERRVKAFAARGGLKASKVPHISGAKQ